MSATMVLPGTITCCNAACKAALRTRSASNVRWYSIRIDLPCAGHGCEDMTDPFQACTSFNLAISAAPSSAWPLRKPKGSDMVPHSDPGAIGKDDVSRTALGPADERPDPVRHRRRRSLPRWRLRQRPWYVIALCRRHLLRAH